MTLGDKQRVFTRNVGRLIEWAYLNGFEITLAEAYRTPEQAQANAANGSGIANSLHCKRLAIDLNLFKDGVYLTKTSDHKRLGAYWESLDESNCWGGSWGEDGNHYSMEHEGIK